MTSIVNFSGLYVQAQWEWCTSAASGRWGQRFQAYRLRQLYADDSATGVFEYGYSVMTSRNKIRGQGRALSLKFTTEPGKNCILYGWNIEIGANPEP